MAWINFENFRRVYLTRKLFDTYESNKTIDTVAFGETLLINVIIFIVLLCFFEVWLHLPLNAVEYCNPFA